MEGLNKMRLVILLVSIMFISSCQWTEPYEPGPSDGSENWDLVLKSANGYSSDVGQVYIQKGLATWFSLSSRSGRIIENCVWTIDKQVFYGRDITYKHNETGPVLFEIIVYFDDGQSLEIKFYVLSVIDLSEADPVQSFVDGSDLLFLISKERIADAVGDDFFYIGSISNWIKRPIAKADHNYIISDGRPVRVSDNGKYIGIRFEAKIGEYSVALVHSDNIWANLSGSSFVRVKENVDQIIFHYDGSKITALGEGIMLYPGNSGDDYFRYSRLSDTKAELYFRLKNGWTNQSFVTFRDTNGLYSTKSSLNRVNDHEEWGVVYIDYNQLSSDILHIRYGPNNSNDVYDINMSKSSFYSETFDAIRIYVSAI